MQMPHDTLLAAGWTYTSTDGYTMRFSGIGQCYVALVSDNDDFKKVWANAQELSAVLCDENNEPVFGSRADAAIDYMESLGPITTAQRWADAKVIKAMQAKARKLAKAHNA